MELINLVNQTGQALGAVGFHAQDVNRGFDQLEGKAGLSLRSYDWRGPRGTEAKCAHLHGPRAEIVNLMVYPRNSLEVPVLAVEIILFGRQPRVAVIDLQPAAGVSASAAMIQSLQTSLGPLHTNLSRGLSEGGPLPEWAEQHFTPWAIYSRPQSLQELPLVLEAFEAYLKVWLSAFYPYEQGPQQGQDRLQHYQRHHLENTPGRRFLATSFGSEWTETYLSEFMYPCSRSAA